MAVWKLSEKVEFDYFTFLQWILWSISKAIDKHSTCEVWILKDWACWFQYIKYANIQLFLKAFLFISLVYFISLLPLGGCFTVFRLHWTFLPYYIMVHLLFKRQLSKSRAGNYLWLSLNLAPLLEHIWLCFVEVY